MMRCLFALLLAFNLENGAARAQTGDEQKFALPTDWFQLEDADAKPVLSEDFQGKFLLVYFGYTHCVDLCPTGLTLLTDSIEQLGPAATHVQPLFITVDPERDRGAMLREFTAAFDKRLLGLTGTDAQVRAAAEPLGVKYQKVDLAAGDYVVDHSSSLSLIDLGKRTGITFKMAEPHLVAAKVFDQLARAGVNLSNVPNLGAYR